MPEEQKIEQQPASEPAVTEASQSAAAAGEPRWRRWRGWYVQHKKWTIPASIILLIIVLAAIPFTRYNIAGLVLKRDLSVKVLDDTSDTPVSGATVAVGQASALTDSSGTAILHHISVGHHKVTLSKKYYTTKTIDALVPVLGQKNVPSAALTATGRQVKITVTDLINHQPLADVDIKAAGTTAKTDKSGSALVVLPAGSAEQKASLSANGYNDESVTVKVSNNSVQNDSFGMTPAGKVYFLSKLSGKIDVVKTNLDGTDRQTVLGGTGQEDDRNTVLLASRDWKYLALLSRRAGSSPSLYLINTSDDSSTVIEEGSSDYTLAGWAGDSFVYTVNHNDIQLWQNGRQVIKSYNAVTKKSTVLDQTAASGTNNFDYLSQLVGDVYAYDDQVFYIMNWTASYSGSTAALANKQATFNSIKTDGSAKKAIRSFGLAQGAQSADITLDERVQSPSAVELHFYDGQNDNFYTYSNGQVKNDSSMSPENFYSSAYPTYLLSPSGNKTFWSEARDGKNTLFIGDEEGDNGKQIATLSDYNTYGWYTDNYLLVSKNSSELYIMDNQAKQNPVKISDYHKPSQVFPGYGGGYGGL